MKKEIESEEFRPKFKLKSSDAKRLKSVAKVMDMSLSEYIKFVILKNIGGSIE